MTVNWNGLRATTGAAALAVALVAGTPAQAKLYSFTLTETEIDNSTNVGSGVIDSNPNFTVDGYGQYDVSNATGYFQPIYTDSVHSGFSASIGQDGYINISTDAYGNGDHQHSQAFGSIDTSNLLTANAISSGLYDEFNSGTYTFTDPHGHWFSASGSGNFNPVSMTLRIGPPAPAPLVGGGLLSALAALLGLGMTRFARRGNVLA